MPAINAGLGGYSRSERMVTMSDYVPMTGPLPGRQYVPSNGTEGACFQEGWCCRCASDKALNGTAHREGREPDESDWCPIVAASYRGEAVEWRELDSGETTCLAFVEQGAEPPPPRCQQTTDLFGTSW